MFNLNKNPFLEMFFNSMQPVVSVSCFVLSVLIILNILKVITFSWVFLILFCMFLPVMWLIATLISLIILFTLLFILSFIIKMISSLF